MSWTIIFAAIALFVVCPALSLVWTLKRKG